MSNVELTDGSPVPDDRSHTELRADGQQKGYVVLSAEERAKGFVKPVRRSYIHRGLQDPGTLIDIPEETLERYGWKESPPFAKFQPDVPARGPNALPGRYWTKDEVARIDKGCGTLTTMGLSLAETYARDPNFYSGTFCCGCHAHFPLNEFVWEDGEPMDTRLQPAWAEKKAAENEARRQKRIAELNRELDLLRSQAPLT